MAINFEALTKKRDDILTNISAAVTAQDSAALEAALTEWTDYNRDMVMNEARGLFDGMDRQILAARGVHALTSEENEYYTQLIAAMKSPNPKAEVTNITVAFPETVIDTVMEDMVQAHPLLSAVDFINTTALTKWVINKKGTQTAVWGAIGSKITKELEGSVEAVTLGLAKLSAFFQVEKDMLDLGPAWVDRYIRAILTDSLAVGFESGMASGDGKDMPIGMDRDLEGGTDANGRYSKKTAIAVTSFTPASYGDLVSRLAVVPVDEGEEPRYRDVSNLIMVVNPIDYYKVVGPATTILTPDGRYVNDVLPFPTTIIKSAAVTSGEAILGLGKRYFMGVGTGKNGKIEYSDEFAFLDDLRTYKIKAHATGKPKDNNAFLLLDITGLNPVYFTVNTVNEGDENP
ncbi:MAG: phage major capsid protein [Ruminococcus sp.]|nr:phage major capsid protein [Ruminococcus sp.]